MNIFILKLIALFSMITDHYGVIFHNGTSIYRIIGRLAFPIYCFLLVEGYFHTSNIKKYGTRLLIFAFISEIPFDLAFYNNPGFAHQNIFFTLFIGLTAMYFIDKYKGYFKYAEIYVIIASCIIAVIFNVDYNSVGIIYILCFYYAKKLKKPKRFLAVACLMFVANIGSSPLQQFSILSLPILLLYNGKPGYKNKFLQLCFYAAYPLHLLLFYAIKLYLA